MSAGPKPPISAWKAAPLLFGSGLCALVYQVVWQRELRLVFGASTAASAAVVAIFAAGLGAGAAVLGRRADAHPRPLALYARLEGIIAATAAASPLLLGVVRRAYVGLGGTQALGPFGGTVLRLALSALVLGAPTFAMGGTLPAAARAVQSEGDRRRRGVALLYGVNTLGAVAGCLAAELVLIGALGMRRTLLAACGANAAVAAVAYLAFGRAPAAPAREDAKGEAAPPAPSRPPSFVLLAAGVSGFVFFLMELVWYRTLGPLLGGTVFTFGLLLATALLGIGLGGTAYALWGSSRPPSMRGLAYTCLIEAACLAVAYALGDRTALFALLLRPPQGAGFAAHVAGWSAVGALVILPAALVAGFQYPLLIGLSGRGRGRVGREIGILTACNTAGSIAGAVAGGFGLLPLLGASGAWRLAIYAIALLGGAAVVVALWEEERALPLVPAGLLGGLVVLLARSPGPGVVWRHTPIGAGRVSQQVVRSPNRYRAWLHHTRRAIRWQAEGIESSVATDTTSGVALLVNGKVDGNARADAPTQVMAGLLGSLLHPRPRSALVIGLGGGSSAGWLARVPEIERVDVWELEPAVAHVARASSAVNEGALDHPRVRLRFADAREALLTSRERWDVVLSEPSNPYRAGVASLFTLEYYRAIADRLDDGGLFLQWLQAYEVRPETVSSVYATLAAVFPSVETWRLGTTDLCLVASRHPLEHDADRLRARIAEEPYRRALANAWRVAGLEGLLSHYVASPAVTPALVQAGAEPSTDDRNLVELGFARALGQVGLGDALVVDAARRLRADQPVPVGASAKAGILPDRARIDDERLAHPAGEGQEWEVPPGMPPEREARAKALRSWGGGRIAEALDHWRAQAREPEGPTELALVAEGLADEGDERAVVYAERLRGFQPVEADIAVGCLRLRQKRAEDAALALEAAFVRARTDPWASLAVMHRGLVCALDAVTEKPELAPRARAMLSEPFAASVVEATRVEALIILAARTLDRKCDAVWRGIEPHVPWDRAMLEERRDCYQRAHSSRVRRASADLERFDRCEVDDAPASCWW